MGHPAISTLNPGHPSRQGGYERRRPEQTVLYQLVAEHWPGLRELAEQVGALPNFVIREFEEYLRCGILEHGFLELVCRHCGDSELVALGCISYCTSRARAVAPATILRQTASCSTKDALASRASGNDEQRIAFGVVAGAELSIGGRHGGDCPECVRYGASDAERLGASYACSPVSSTR